MKYIFLSIIGVILLCGSSASAQIHITGSVYDEQNHPVENVLVMLHRVSDSAIMRFTLTDGHGNYDIEYMGSDFNLLISVSRIDIKKQMKFVVKRNQQLNFVIEKNITRLEEVEIRPEKVMRSGDTLSFLIPAFMNNNDMVIGDVMRRIPGMRVYENGTISYRGRMIRTLYVEDIDMTNGRYGMMTNTIAAEDVYAVQVLESYEPIKILKKTRFSDEVALNIKMKSNTKEKRKVNATLGSGGDFGKQVLWNGEVVGMYVGNKNQHLFSYKSNNAGIDVRREQGSNSNYFPISRSPFTQMSIPTPPDINLKHYFFNNTHAITSQNAYKASDVTDWMYNIRYNYNEEKRNSFSRTSYGLTGDSVRLVVEDIDTEMNTHKLEGEVLYKYNTENTYFNNFLNISSAWDDGSGVIDASGVLSQQYQNRSLEAVNNTHLVKKKKASDNGIDLNLTQAFLLKPHQLTITPGLYSSIFNNGEDYNALQQHATYNSFSSGNKLSFLSAIKFGNVRINPTVHCNIQTQHLSSHFMSSRYDQVPMQMIDDPKIQNQTDWMRVNSGVSLEIFYNMKGFNLMATLPFTYNWFYLNNMSQEFPEAWIVVYFQPTLYMYLNLSKRWSISNSIELNDYAPDLRSLYTGYILRNYRTLNYYEGSTYNAETAKSRTRLSYRNAAQQFYSTLTFSYEQYVSDGIYGQVFKGNLSATQLKMIDNSFHSYVLHWDASKGISWHDLLLSLQIKVGKSDRDQFRQSKMVAYHSQWSQITLSANMELVPGITLRNSSYWLASVAQVGDAKKSPAMYDFNNRVRFDFNVIKNANLFSTWDYYFMRSQNGDKHFSIFDIGAQYTHKRVNYSLLWNNILNTRHYVSSYYANMNSYYTEYEIRPASIMFNVQFRLF